MVTVLFWREVLNKLPRLNLINDAKVKILSSLSRNKKGLRFTDMRELDGLDNPVTLTRNLRDLLNIGWIERYMEEKAKRNPGRPIFRYRITEKGEKALKMIQKIRKELQKLEEL